ncbi:hypothetical protein RhiLY_13972 [Ceratobasidium sp. AG-Ba]|nr:hypothetical protein RhiLY_13972 [Ceratobasidium sp. AG-Ba]
MAFTSSMGFFYLVGFILLGSVLVWWGTHVYSKRKKRAVTQRNQAFGPPVVPTFGPNHDPVVLAEAGENANAPPKYSTQAGVGEQIVERNTGIFEMMRPNWMSRSNMPRQTATPSQPPPAYNPSAPRPPTTR